MNTFVNAPPYRPMLYRALVLALLGIVPLGLGGCGQQQQADTAAQKQAFGGDPAMKAKMGAQIRAQAEKGRAQAEAAARKNAGPPPAGAPAGAPATPR